MFGSQQDPSKTEAATPKQIEKQRNKGNVPKSQELAKFISIVAGLIGLNVWVGTMGEELMILFRKFFTGFNAFEANTEEVYSLFIWTTGYLAKILLPLLLFLLFCVGIGMRLQVGKLWTFEVFKMNWDRFNVIAAIKRMFFSSQTIVRLLKSFLFAVTISIIPAIVISSEFVNFLPMFYENSRNVAIYMLNSGFNLVCYTLIPMACITAFDVWQTRYAYYEGLKMTKNEVKDENKQREGDPIIKQKQRQKMMEQMAKRMYQDIPKADVIITNPTHIAVAIAYNAAEAPAPVVVAKGAGHIAEKIKDIARENRVPIRENVPLARALYKATEIGDMIPEELYKATASILANIWRMQGKMPKRPQ